MDPYIDLPPTRDGRVFKARPVHLTTVGKPVLLVEEIEALTGARLKAGEDAILFIRRWFEYKKHRDPNAGISFADYIRKICPDAIIEASTNSVTASVPVCIPSEIPGRATPAGKRWIWDLYPLSRNAWAARLADDKGGAGTVITFVNFQIGPMGKSSDSETHHQMYMPTDDDFEVIQRLYPNDDPHQPQWYRIEATLVIAGNDASAVSKWSAIVLLDALRKLKPAAPSPALAKRCAGRPVETDPARDRRLFEAWHTGSYRTFEQLARAMNLTDRQVRLAIDRHKKRLRRARE